MAPRLAPAPCENLGLPGPGSLPLGYQGNLTVIIAEAYSHEPVVRNSLVYVDEVKIPLIDASLRESDMESGYQGLVFRADRADDESPFHPQNATG